MQFFSLQNSNAITTASIITLKFILAHMGYSGGQNIDMGMVFCLYFYLKSTALAGQFGFFYIGHF